MIHLIDNTADILSSGPKWCCQVAEITIYNKFQAWTQHQFGSWALNVCRVRMYLPFSWRWILVGFVKAWKDKKDKILKTYSACWGPMIVPDNLGQLGCTDVDAAMLLWSRSSSSSRPSIMNFSNSLYKVWHETLQFNSNYKIDATDPF